MQAGKGEVRAGAQGAHQGAGQVAEEDGQAGQEHTEGEELRGQGRPAHRV